MYILKQITVPSGLKFTSMLKRNFHPFPRRNFKMYISEINAKLKLSIHSKIIYCMYELLGSLYEYKCNKMKKINPVILNFAYY